MRYREQLKDPRWKSKSIEIKLRDNEECQKCITQDNLEVHHIRYLKGVLLWDYPDNYLITLCRDCHQEETDNLNVLEGKIESMLTAGLFARDVLQKFNISFHPRLEDCNLKYIK